MGKKSREIFRASGESEENEQVEASEEAARVRFVEKPAKDPELENILSQVDFGLLRGIFERIVERCGLDPRSMNFVGPERIAHSGLGLSTASYLAAENIIGIAYQKLRPRAEELGVDSVTAAVETLCHEETHATSRVECRGLEQWWADPATQRMSTKTGYSRWVEGRNKPADFFFYLFNEGVTEKLSREVFREYAQGSGFPDGVAVATIERAFIEKSTEVPYGVPVKFVEALIAKLHHETGVDQKLVWQALIRGMYEGEEFRDQELRSMFAEVISTDFLDKLSRADYPHQLEELLGELAVPQTAIQTVPSTRQKLRSWLDRLIARIGPKTSRPEAR